MAVVLNHDIQITQGARWSMGVGYFNPLPNGLPDMSSPVDPTDWTAVMSIVGGDLEPETPLKVITNVPGNGIVVQDDLSFLLSLSSIETAGLPLMVGEYDFLVQPPMVGWDDLLMTGRVVVTPLS